MHYEAIVPVLFPAVHRVCARCFYGQIEKLTAGYCAWSILWFFQNGALDAAAYSETSQTILQLLWKATQIQDVGGTAVRASALKSLCQYEVCGVSEFIVGTLLIHVGFMNQDLFNSKLWKI